MTWHQCSPFRDCLLYVAWTVYLQQVLYLVYSTNYWCYLLIICQQFSLRLINKLGLDLGPCFFKLQRNQNFISRDEHHCVNTKPLPSTLLYNTLRSTLVASDMLLGERRGNECQGDLEL